MLRWKRVDILIKAVGILLNEGSNIHLTLIGHGPEEDRLRKMADAISFKKINKNIMPNGSTPTSDQHFAEPPSYITFHPPVPIAQVRDLLRKSDVYVLPSDGGEGWGAVLNEAMEEGCAVIATHECGSGATMIKDGENGLLFNAGDVNGLVCCLNRLYNDDVFRSKLRGGARETVGHLWNPTIASTRLLSVCEELLCGGNVTCYTDGPLKSVSSLVGLSAQTSNNRL
jgi:glycosyltransferase involved in cell wall biosynthesis